MNTLLNPPLVSCIIISYNQDKFIYEAIDSVLCQEYKNIELIVADDCSTSFNMNQLNDYINKKRNDSISSWLVYSNPINLGTVKNINTAIGKARGEYIKIFGADDALANCSVISTQIQFLMDNPQVPIVTGKSMQCDQEMNPIYDKYVELTNRLIIRVNELNSKSAKRRFIRKNYIFPYVTQSMCFRRRFFDEYGLYDEKYRLLEDTPMSERIIEYNICVGFVDEYVIKHRTRVGISSADIIYSNRSRAYYFDCKILAESKIESSNSLLEKISLHHQKRIASFRIKLCDCKGSRKEKIVIVLKYFPNILLYILRNPKKAYVKSRRKLT